MSLLEKETTTDPAVMGLPQSSATWTAISCGQAAVSEKPCATLVNTGTSVVGAHPAACTDGRMPAVETLAETLMELARIKRIAIVRIELSEKASVNAP